MDIIIVLPDDVEPTEYFCIACLQFRLSFRRVNACCEKCGSDRIIKGAVGTLNKAELLARWKP